MCQNRSNLGCPLDFPFQAEKGTELMTTHTHTRTHTQPRLITHGPSKAGRLDLVKDEPKNAAERGDVLFQNPDWSGLFRGRRGEFKGRRGRGLWIYDLIVASWNQTNKRYILFFHSQHMSRRLPQWFPSPALRPVQSWGRFCFSCLLLGGSLFTSKNGGVCLSMALFWPKKRGHDHAGPWGGVSQGAGSEDRG